MVMESICELAICAAAYLLTNEEDVKRCEEEEQRKIRTIAKATGINAILRSREEVYFCMHATLLQDEVAFKRYYHMSPSTFKELLTIICDDITPSRDHGIMPEEQLSATIRFMVTGINHTMLSSQYLISAPSLGKIFRTVWTVILKRLRHVEIATPTKQEWLKIADEFLSKWDFPQCLGSIGGKYFRMLVRRNRHLIVLAVVDANYMFRLIDIGPYGKKDDDCRIFTRSNIGKKLLDKNFDVPEKRQLPMSDAQEEEFFFAANESFPLRKHIMRPYSGDNLSQDQLHFNDRLSTARNTVSHAFHMLTNKWSILLNRIRGHLDTGTLLLEASCVLHNFIERREGIVLENTSRYSFAPSTKESAPVFTSKGADKSRDHLTSYLSQVFCQEDK